MVKVETRCWEFSLQQKNINSFCEVLSDLIRKGLASLEALSLRELGYS